MNIQDGLNPFRLYTKWFENDILLQIEDDEQTLTVTQSKQNKKSKSKAKILWEGTPTEFIKFDDDGQIRTAFKNFIFSIK